MEMKMKIIIINNVKESGTEGNSILILVNNNLR